MVIINRIFLNFTNLKIIGLILFILLLFFPGKFIYAEAEWTVLVYMAADNNLSQSAFKDINEMESIEQNDSINIIVQIDPNENESFPPYFTTCRKYLINYDENPDSIGSTLLADLGEINSADPYYISSFANITFSDYPSQKRMLVLWDHGDGWYKENNTKYICYDNSHLDKISVAEGELKEAIEQIDYNIDILVFDACLMQMVEVLGEIYEYCDIIIGSEETIPQDGLLYGDYEEFACSNYGIFNYLGENPKCIPEDFSIEIVERYINSYSTGCQGYNGNISMSALNTQYFPIFKDSVRYFTDTYSDTIYNQIYESIHEDCYLIENNIDVREFFNKLSSGYEKNLSTSASNIKSLIDSMIISAIAIYDDELISGLGNCSIYFPIVSDYFYWSKYKLLSFVENTKWDRFLTYYYNTTSPPCILDFNIYYQNSTFSFSWMAESALTLKYKLEYSSPEDSSYTSLLDSNYTYKTVHQSCLPSGKYSFKLTVIDEWHNECDTIRNVDFSKNYFYFFPNPILTLKNPTGKFIFSNNMNGTAKIYIYNFSGNLVKILTKNTTQNSHIEIEFKVDDFAAGIYFCLLKTGNRSEMTKLAIIR